MNKPAKNAYQDMHRHRLSNHEVPVGPSKSERPFYKMNKMINLDLRNKMVKWSGQDLIALRRNDDLRNKRVRYNIQVKENGERALPISVTLTALRSVPEFSSTTAMLLTPCSLMSFMASRIEADDLAATTASLRFKQGRDNDWIGFERYLLNDGVSRAYELNHERSRRSETIPTYSPGFEEDSMRTVERMVISSRRIVRGSNTDFCVLHGRRLPTNQSNLHCGAGFQSGFCQRDLQK